MLSNGEPAMLTAARRQADERAANENKQMIVYYLAHDQWGRDAVWFVRSVDEERPYGDGKAAEIVYRTEVK